MNRHERYLKDYPNRIAETRRRRVRIAMWHNKINMRARNRIYVANKRFQELIHRHPIAPAPKRGIIDRVKSMWNRKV